MPKQPIHIVESLAAVLLVALNPASGYHSIVTPALRSAPDSACSAFRSSASNRSPGRVLAAALPPRFPPLFPLPPSAAAPAIGAQPLLGLTARPKARMLDRRASSAGAGGRRPLASYAHANAALQGEHAIEISS